MGLVARLTAAAEVTVKTIGSLDLIASKDVDAFLRAARTLDVTIIGVEGFRIEKGRAVPDMDAIADFSGLPHDDKIVAATIEEAGRFLSEVSRPDMYFDFVLDEADDDL